MNEEQLDDLKQFIDSRISQAEARLEQKIDGTNIRVDSLDKEFKSLRKEMLDGFAGVGEAIEEINKHFDERLAKLEKQAA